MRTLPLFIGLFLLGKPALATEVFVNGTNVEGLTSQTFERATVRIDEKGNVHIEAPGYKVHRVSPGKDTGSTAAVNEAILSKKYFLVTEQSPSGMTEFDIDVAINGKSIRTLRSGDEQHISDVTKHLKPGHNVVLLHARKVLSNKERPKSTSRAHVFRVIIGEGSTTDEQVIIDKPVITFTRTAAEPNDVVQEYDFTTR